MENTKDKIQATWISFNNKESSSIEKIQNVINSLLINAEKSFGKESEEYYFLKSINLKKIE